MLVQEQRFGFQPGKPNAGWVRAVWLLRSQDVLALLDPEQLPVPGQPMTVNRGGVLVANDAVVTRLRLPTQTARFEETPTTDRAGTLYGLTLTLTLPRPSAALTHYLHTRPSTRWVAIWEDGNGQGWIGGEPGNGLRLLMSQAQTEVNAMKLVLSGRSAHSAWRLESTDLNALFPDAGFDFSFDLSFDA